MRAQLSRMLKSQTGELPTRHETDVCPPVSLGHKEFLFYFSPHGGRFATSRLVTAGFIQFSGSVCAFILLSQPESVHVPGQESVYSQHENVMQPS